MPSGTPDAVIDAATLDQFLVLPENRFAHSVLISRDPAVADAATTDVVVPPVYLHGPSGTGKTHLVRAAVRQWEGAHPDWKILTITAAEFSARFTEAADNREFRNFRKQFQRLDVLAIEDLSALAKRLEPQHQLVALWDDLLAHQCRLIITCRTSAAEVAGLIPELVNRCHAAVCVPIRLPSPNSRERLLAHWAQALGMALAPEVIPFLAEKFAVTPRELFGAITQLRGISQQRRQPLDVELVRRHLLGQHPSRVFSIAEIAKSVARHFQVTLADLRAKSRQPNLVLPRQCAMSLIRELTDQSLKKIGDYFGGRDHSTVLHACHKFDSLLPDQPDLRQHLAKIRLQLQVPE